MIPKIIHFCWLSGDKYPALISHCMKSWHKLLSDYQFMLWDTKRFPLDQSAWVREAFDKKKYAFAADYIRLYAVYNYGGIYLDCDVEVLKRFDDLLDLPYFIGEEAYSSRCEIAAFGAEKGCQWIKRCMDYYKDRHFILKDGSFDMKPMPDVINDLFNVDYNTRRIQSIDDFDRNEDVINSFPCDWFCAHVALHPETNSKLNYIITENTYCIHHFANSWIPRSRVKRYAKVLLNKFGLMKLMKR